MVFQVPRERQVEQQGAAHLETVESLEPLATQEPPDNVVLREMVDLMEPPEPPETEEMMEPREQKETLVCQDELPPAELEVKRETPDNREPPEPRENVVKMD